VDLRVLRRGQVPDRNTQDRRPESPRLGGFAHSSPGRVLSWPVGVAPVRDRQDCDDPRPVIDGIKRAVLTAPG